MPAKPKTDFLRGLVLFNPSVYPPGSPRNRERIAGKIADYDAAEGGRWNYDDFFQVVRQVLKGASFDQAMSHLGSLEGSGEAAAKTGLLSFIDRHMKLAQSEFVECGPRQFQLDQQTRVSLAPDFAYRRDGILHHVFVYPNREPALSQLQREMITSIMSQPFSGEQEEYVFCLIEYPSVDGKRTGRYQEIPFGYSNTPEDFLVHLSDFYSGLAVSRGGQGSLF